MDGVFIMVIAIVAISCATGLIREHLKTRRHDARKAPGPDLEAELQALKRRVAVLEEIVTDERYHLNRELDHLERHG